MTRVMPVVGMQATVEGFAARERAIVVAVELDGRRLVVESGESRRVFTLRRLTGRYVEEGQPYYGPRLRLSGAGGEPR